MLVLYMVPFWVVFQVTSLECLSHMDGLGGHLRCGFLIESHFFTHS